MAFNLENMSVNYKKLLDVVPTQRMQLASSGAIDDLISALTPGQLVNLFPRYYRQQLPDVGQINQFAPSLDKALSGGMSYSPPAAGGTAQQFTPGPQVKTTLSPEEKATQELFKEAFPNQVGSEVSSGLMNDKGRVISTASIDMSPQERALLDTIAHGESPDYNTIAGGTKFEGFADHPRTFGNLGTTAAGRYQFVKATWDGVVKEYNRINPDNPITDFSPENQDRAALYLAQRDYKTRTGRDLKADLDSPPENFGELVRYGLGGFAQNTTWQAFQKMTKDEIQKIFDSNYERNIGYVEQREADAAKIKPLEDTVQFDPSMIGQLDQRLQNWYNTASEIQKKRFEKALEKLGTEKFNETMKKQPVNTATLGAVAAVPVEGSRVIEQQQGFRSSPIKPELRNQLEYAAEQSGLYVKVFSGGQTEEQQAALTAQRAMQGQKGPSDRHDIENPDTPGAADVHLAYRDADGKEVILDQSNPEHWDKIAEFTRNQARVTEGAGVGGWSPNDNYMGKNAIHFGGPNKKGDPPLAYQGMDYLKQAHAEGVALREQDKKSGYDPLIEWQKKKQKELEDKISADAAARAQASPVSAIQNQMEADAAEKGLPTPSFKDGGQFDVPPGENITAVDDYGNVKFTARETESIKIDPSGLENVQPIPDSQTHKEEVVKLEQPVPARTMAQPVPDYMNNPQMFQDIADGITSMPPSVIRAANRAKLYGETSSSLVNGHFS